MSEPSDPVYPIFSPSIGSAESEAVDRVMRSGWIAQAGEVVQFEAAVARRLDVSDDRVTAVSSGTAALHLALILAGVGPGDDVLVPALGFIATANAVRYCGANPVFVECDSKAFTSNVDHFAAAVTPRTRAVIPVHNCGRMAPMNEIVPWAREVGYVVIEDAAPAMGATLDDVAAGAWGDFGCFSLHSSKPITAGEGGVLVARNREEGERSRCLRFHGASVYDFTEVDFRSMWEEEYVEVGFNYRMTDLQAAIASVQLERLDDFLAARQSRCDLYDELLGDIAGVDIAVPLPGPSATVWQQYVVVLEDSDIARRNAILGACRAEGVFAMPGVSFLPAQPLWGKDSRPTAERRFPAAAAAEASAISLPLSTAMTDGDVDAVAAIFRSAVKAAS